MTNAEIAAEIRRLSEKATASVWVAASEEWADEGRYEEPYIFTKPHSDDAIRAIATMRIGLDETAIDNADLIVFLRNHALDFAAALEENARLSARIEQTDVQHAGCLSAEEEALLIASNIDIEHEHLRNTLTRAQERNTELVEEACKSGDTIYQLTVDRDEAQRVTKATLDANRLLAIECRELRAKLNASYELLREANECLGLHCAEWPIAGKIAEFLGIQAQPCSIAGCSIVGTHVHFIGGPDQS